MNDTEPDRKSKQAMLVLEEGQPPCLHLAMSFYTCCARVG